MAQGDHQSLHHVEPVEGGDDDLALGGGDEVDGVGCCTAWLHGDAQLGVPPPPAGPALVARRVGDDPQEPRPEATLRVDRGDRPPRSFTRRLHDVVGVGGVAEHDGGDAERAAPVTGNEPAVGTGIAPLGLPDEIPFIVVDASVLVDRHVRHGDSR